MRKSTLKPCGVIFDLVERGFYAISLAIWGDTSDLYPCQWAQIRKDNA